MHLDENMLALFFEKKLTSDEKKIAEEHLAECTECSEALADLITFHEEMDSITIGRSARKNLKQAKQLVKDENKVSLLPKFSAAVALLVIFTVTFLYFNSNELNQPSRYRAGEHQYPVIKLFPATDAVLDKAHLKFKWNALPDIFAFKFLLYNSDGALHFERLVESHEIDVSDYITLENDKQYLWRVEVIYPDNTKERSSLHVFTYKE